VCSSDLQLFMAPIDDPFACVAETLETYRLGQSVDAIVFDIHGEATSEKQALAYLADGKVSFSVGTHTHVPTADARVLAGGSAYMTDVGMCGDYHSVIGMEVENSLARFVKKRSAGRLVAAAGEATLCALFVETDDATGLAKRALPVRVGGILEEKVPG